MSLSDLEPIQILNESNEQINGLICNILVQLNKKTKKQKTKVIISEPKEEQL